MIKRLKKFVDDFDFVGIISGRWFFSLIFILALIPLVQELAKPFLSLDHYSFNLNGKSLELIAGHEEVWRKIKIAFNILSLSACGLFGTFIYRIFFESARFMQKPDIEQEDVQVPSYPYDSDKLQLIVGLKHKKLSVKLIRKPTWLTITGKHLFQNILITGATGMGKTTCTMYPFLKQIMGYRAFNPDEKAGMLILDVKGNFYMQVVEYAKLAGREKDLVIISPNGEYYYNPLHKPDMDALDLAQRCQHVTEVMSGGKGNMKNDRFWDNKAIGMFSMIIKLLRAINNGYITMWDIHKVVSNEKYAHGLVDKYANMIAEGKIEVDRFEAEAVINYFTGEFRNKEEGGTIPTIKTCVTEITEAFANSPALAKNFCPDLKDLNFSGFDDVINSGKIIVLAMNIAKYPQLSKIISAYSKLDFQAEVLKRAEPGTSLNTVRPVFMMCDEYQEYVTSNDGEFMGLSRESKCGTIVSSQSFSSIKEKITSDDSFNVLIQNIANKIWLRTDDSLTVKKAQELTGKHEVKKVSHSIGENSSDTRRSHVLGKFVSDRSSLTESVNVSKNEDFVLTSNLMSKELHENMACCFLTCDGGMQDPCVVHLTPSYGAIIENLNINPKEVIRNEETINA